MTARAASYGWESPVSQKAHRRLAEKAEKCLERKMKTATPKNAFLSRSTAVRFVWPFGHARFLCVLSRI